MPWSTLVPTFEMAPSQASNLAFSTAALLASLLLIIQLPIHFQPAKSSNWLFLVWITLRLLNSSMNSIVWNDNVVNWAPVWCDISSNLLLASDFGMQLGLLCISRRLYQAVTSKIASDYEERRRMLLDIFVAIIIPILWLSLDYVFEGQQFVIVEQEGCYPAILATIPTILLLLMWPPIFALLTAIYSGLTIIIMRRHRARVREFDDSGDKAEYQWRLTLFASAQIVLILPSSVYNLVVNSTEPRMPYNWEVVHAGFSNVYGVPLGDWVHNARTIVEFELFSRWMYVAYAVLFVALFGWTKRARDHYNKYYGRAFFAAIRLFGYHAQSGSGTRQARKDLEHGSLAHGPVFRTFLTSLTTSFGASRVTSTQATTTYHTAIEQVVSVPEVPAPTYCAPTHEHDPLSQQLQSGETSVTRTLTNDNVPPTSPVARPELAFLAHNHP